MSINQPKNVLNVAIEVLALVPRDMLARTSLTSSARLRG